MFTCDICHKSVKYRSSLTRHISNIHQHDGTPQQQPSNNLASPTQQPHHPVLLAQQQQQPVVVSQQQQQQQLVLLPQPQQQLQTQQQQPISQGDKEFLPQQQTQQQHPISQGDKEFLPQQQTQQQQHPISQGGKEILSQQQQPISQRNTEFFDIRLKENFKIFISGPSRSGKTVFVKNLLQKLGIFSKSPTKLVTLVYKIYQPIYNELNLSYIIEDGPNLKERIINLTNGEPMLIIFDDCINSLQLPEISDFFLVDGRHRNLSCIFISQKIFINNDNFREITQNSDYFIIFKNPRNIQEIRTLNGQMTPGSVELISYYKLATSDPFSYLFINLTQECRNEVKYLSHLFKETHHVTAYLNNTSKKLTDGGNYGDTRFDRMFFEIFNGYHPPASTQYKAEQTGTVDVLAQGTQTGMEDKAEQTGTVDVLAQGTQTGMDDKTAQTELPAVGTQGTQTGTYDKTAQTELPVVGTQGTQTKTYDETVQTELPVVGTQGTQTIDKTIQTVTPSTHHMGISSTHGPQPRAMTDVVTPYRVHDISETNYSPYRMHAIESTQPSRQVINFRDDDMLGLNRRKREKSDEQVNQDETNGNLEHDSDDSLALAWDSSSDIHSSVYTDIQDDGMSGQVHGISETNYTPYRLQAIESTQHGDDSRDVTMLEPSRQVINFEDDDMLGLNRRKRKKSDEEVGQIHVKNDENKKQKEDVQPYSLYSSNVRLQIDPAIRLPVRDKCFYCQSYDHRKSCILHKSKSGLILKPRIRCKICSVTTRSEQGLKNHMKKIHHFKDFTRAKLPYIKSSTSMVRKKQKFSHNVLKCNICETIFLSTNALKLHRQSCKPTVYACSICGKNWPLISGLKRHMKSMHEDKKR